MSEDPETEIRRLMAVQPDDESKNTRLSQVLKRTRAGVGQRDSILFAVVKIWTTIAEMLAPIFAQFAERKAATERARARLSGKSSAIEPGSQNTNPNSEN
ncbi:MAG: hypothetical protein AAF385_09255 [Pseudomonadota bacterium]